MCTRYEKFNEIAFEKYCRTSITNAILKGRMEKAKRASREISIDELSDGLLYSLKIDSDFLEDGNLDIMIFDADGIKIAVRDAELGQALSFLPGRKRNIVLLSYFMDMSDKEIAQRTNMSKSAVQRWRNRAVRDLKILLGVRS